MFSQVDRAEAHGYVRMFGEAQKRAKAMSHEPCHAEVLVPATFSFQIVIGDSPTPEKGGKARSIDRGRGP